MADLFVILLCSCKLAFLASSTCIKIIEFSLKNEAKKAYLHVLKRIIIIPAIYERGLCQHSESLSCPFLIILEYEIRGFFSFDLNSYTCTCTIVY